MAGEVILLSILPRITVCNGKQGSCPHSGTFHIAKRYGQV
jgi:hypothetical protein